MIYETVQEKPRELSLQKACETVSVSRDGYLKWHTRKPDPPSKKDAVLLRKIQEIKEEFAYYGYRRVAETLNKKVTVANHKMVFRLMREHHWTVKRKRFSPKTTTSNKSDPRFPNLAIGKILNNVNQVWDTDITYVPLDGGFLYLALLTDRFSKKCVGWQLSRNCDSLLCEDALRRAFKLRKGVSLEGTVHHGDHGSQYLSRAYLALLAVRGMLPSLGETGNCYENPFAESMNKTVKYDFVYRKDYETFEEVYRIIEEAIMEYNNRRIHSSIGYMTPNEFERELKRRRTLLPVHL